VQASTLVALAATQEAVVEHQSHTGTTCKMQPASARVCVGGVRQLCSIMHVNAMQSKVSGTQQNPLLFSGPLSRSLRFCAQLVADFVAINNINVGSGSLSSLSLVSTGFFSHPFSSVLLTPLIFFYPRSHHVG
jgi:hypothetical protein